jgi:hypothetical protein
MKISSFFQIRSDIQLEVGWTNLKESAHSSAENKEENRLTEIEYERKVEGTNKTEINFVYEFSI